MKTKIFISLLLTLFGVSSFAGDIIVLNKLIDSTQISFEGKVTKIHNCMVEFKRDTMEYEIPSSEIYMIIFENASDRVYNKYLNMADTDPEKCMKGQMDAQMYHGKVLGHFMLGVLVGPFAAIGAGIASPSPQSGANTYMLSKNKELFSDPMYLMCYQKKAKTKNVTSALAGWGSWILLVLIFAGAAQ